MHGANSSTVGRSKHISTSGNYGARAIPIMPGDPPPPTSLVLRCPRSRRGFFSPQKSTLFKKSPPPPSHKSCVTLSAFPQGLFSPKKAPPPPQVTSLVLRRRRSRKGFLPQKSALFKKNTPKVCFHSEFIQKVSFHGVQSKVHQTNGCICRSILNSGPTGSPQILVYQSLTHTPTPKTQSLSPHRVRGDVQQR